MISHLNITDDLRRVFFKTNIKVSQPYICRYQGLSLVTHACPSKTAFLNKQIKSNMVFTLLIQVSNLGPSVVRNKSGVETEKQKGGYASLMIVIISDQWE